MLRRNGNTQPLLALEVPERREIWRPIHYLGSKLRLAESISNMLDQLDPDQGPVCDLFAGSGTVSLALSDSRDVIAADIQEYSRVLCTALLQPVSFEDDRASALLARAAATAARLESCLTPILQFEELAIDRFQSKPAMLCDLSEHGSLIAGRPEDAALATAIEETNRLIARNDADAALMMTRYFGGSYFSFRQALQLDSLLASIDEPRETGLAAVLSTASTIVSSVGKQFAQPMRPRNKDGSVKSHLIQQMCRDRSQDAMKVFKSWLSRYRFITQARNHRVIRDDYRGVLAKVTDVSVVYADPPYTRDHYSRFYHVLETLCRRDSPGVSTTLLRGEGSASRGLYRNDRHQSPFCIKSQAPAAFAQLFTGVRRLDVPLLISYSPFVKDGHPRLMTVEAIAELAKQQYGHVDIAAAGALSHSKLNRTALHREASTAAEVFIVCRI